MTAAHRWAAVFCVLMALLVVLLADLLAELIDLLHRHYWWRGRLASRTPVVSAMIDPIRSRSPGSIFCGDRG